MYVTRHSAFLPASAVLPGPGDGHIAPGASHREKDPAIETLRGIAIVLVVAFHAIGDDSPSGKVAGDAGLFSHFNCALNYLRMPLFTVISGFVYAMHPAAPGATLAFLKGKARRLLVPFLAVSTLTWALRTVFRQYSNNPTDDLAHVLVYGIDQFWFLQAVFLALAVAAILDRYGLMSRPGRWLLCVVAAAALAFALPGWRAFSVDGFLYLLPYLLFGCGIGRFPGLLRSPAIVGSAALLLLAGLVGQQLAWAGRLPIRDDRTSLLALGVGLSSNLLLFRARRPLPILPVLGRYSFAIYLFHFFALAIANRLALLEGLRDTDLLVALRWIFGLLLPIPAEVALRRSRLLRRLFLGLR